ncbi:chronophin isoform X1 [Drosophila willistoni]|uniref:chronophin isoform X1 n=1 Tax=Drosophila willistoni TaxID=7260 RepID=UPI000C26C408|nr:chronophin isoform X1 [Drosophila willistoni]
MCEIKPKHIKELSKEERQKFFDSFDLVLCDCDGVVWHPFRDFIPGSARAIDQLQRLHRKKLTFVTNNSVSSLEEHLEKFAKQGQLNITKNQIVHPAQTICDHLKKIQFKGLIYCLATPPFRQLLIEAGFQLTQDSMSTGAKAIESVRDLHEAIYGGSAVQAVIIDVDFNLSAAKIMRAQVQLQNPECLFLAGAADARIPFGRGEIIGPGAFIDLVAKASGRQPLVLGKPGEALGQLMLQRHKATPAHRVLFVGDSLASDIAFGHANGYQTLLVMTAGKSEMEKRLKDMAKDHSEMPDYVVDCLGDLLIEQS